MNSDMAVLKIAKSGGNAETDAEKDLVLTSNRSCMIEMISGIITLNGSGLGEITHNFGYRPAFYAFLESLDFQTSSYNVWYPQYNFYQSLVGKVDTTKLYLDGELNARAYYIIFANQQDNSVGTSNTNASGRLRIAKPGYDAETATDARQLQFMSGTSVPKVDLALSGSITQTIATDDYTVITVAHNLGYVPLCFVLCDTFGTMLPDSSDLFPSFIYHIDDTNLTIIASDFSFAPTYNATFKYKILRDRIE